MRKGCVFLIAMLCGVQAFAQTSLERGDRRVASQISPYYFGPNAFPVPDMLDGTVSKYLRIEADVDHFFGKRGDHTTDIFLKLNIPLFSDRVNLSAWMTAVEWYRNTDESIEACRLTENVKEYPEIRKGHHIGDVYVSADIQVLKEKRVCPDLSVRAVLKTASDDGFHLGRYYDSAGYFFDTSVGKSFSLGWGSSLRIAATTGFLCWQTDNGRQNDAVMFGGMARLEKGGLSVTGSFNGYSGWEHTVGDHPELAHDEPMVLKGVIGYKYKMFEFNVTYLAGVKDYPYRQLRAGVAYNIDILK